MPDPERTAPNLPAAAGRLGRLHLRAGDLLIRGRALFRPKLMLGVRLLAFDDEGRVFLVRHSYLPGWHLPGGAVEPGETARAAAVREAQEEGGLLLDAPPALVNLYLLPTTGRLDHIALFLARGARAGADRPARFEIREAAFFARDALPAATTPATRARIAEALGEAPIGDRW
jgi:8-oxo-dGTP pyrophosphatase MutT (NUDIX family)